MNISVLSILTDLNIWSATKFYYRWKE